MLYAIKVKLANTFEAFSRVHADMINNPSAVKFKRLEKVYELLLKLCDDLSVTESSTVAATKETALHMLVEAALIQPDDTEVFNKKFYQSISKLMGIDADEFIYLKEKGVRPVKAAIKLGAAPFMAEVLAGLTVTWSIRGINEVYADTNILSCMTGKSVGKFYHANDIGVISGNNFRMLVNKQGMVANRAYGFKGEHIRNILLDSDFLIASNYIFPCDIEEYETHESTYIGYKETTAIVKALVDGFVPSWYLRDAELTAIFGGKDERFEVISEDTVFHEGSDEPEGAYEYLLSHTVGDDGLHTIVHTTSIYKMKAVKHIREIPYWVRPEGDHFVPYVDELGCTPYECESNRVQELDEPLCGNLWMSEDDDDGLPF